MLLLSFIFLQIVWVGESNKKRRVVVGLHFIVALRTAFDTFVRDYKALLGMRGDGTRAHKALAFRGSVSGVDV